MMSAAGRRNVATLVRVVPELGVGPHDGHLSPGQGSRLVEHAGRDRHLPDVVEQRAAREIAQRLVTQPETEAERDGDAGHPDTMDGRPPGSTC